MKNQYHILIIDDDAILLEQAEDILSSKYILSLAISGKQALEYLSGDNKLPDLILLDILMPDMDGYATLSEIRKIPKCNDIPVIFLTGISEPESEVKCLTEGALDYIKKPFSPSVLLARISLALNNIRRFNADYEINSALLSEIPEELTNSELKVLTLMIRSYNNREISNELHYSYDYVKKLSSNILGKLGLKNRSEVKKYRK